MSGRLVVILDSSSPSPPTRSTPRTISGPCILLDSDDEVEPSVVTKQPPARVPTAQAPVASNIISIISSDDDENEIPAPRSVSTESVENDDIIFQHNEISSSPLKRTSAALYSSDDEDRDPCFSTGLSQPLRKQTLFDEFSDDDDDIEKLVHERRKDYGALMGTSIDDMSDGETMPLTRNGSNPVTNALDEETRRTPKRIKSVSSDAAFALAERERKKMEQVAEKERLKKAKETAKKEKRLVAMVNTIRNKSQTVKEMTLELSTDLADSSGTDIKLRMDELGVKVQYRDLPRSGCILVSRNVDRLWDEDTQMWNPCETYVHQEPYVILLMDGYEFAGIVSEGLLQFHGSVESTFPDRKVIYVIRDLDKFYGDKKKQANQAFTQHVRQESPARQTKKTKARAALLLQLPDSKKIEDAMLDLQMASMGNAFINCIPSNQTASWIQTFVAEISILPETLYRSHEALNFDFGDKIKTGKDLADTWLKIIQACHWVTEDRAKAVVDKYPTFESLYKVYKSLSQAQGEDLLTTLKWNSGTQDRPELKNFGSAMSRRVYAAIMSTNPSQSAIHAEQ